MVWQQRHAMFNAAIVLASILAFVSLIPILGLQRAQGAFALMSLLALGPFIWRRNVGHGDERDRAIHLRATQITFGIFWLIFVAGLMGLYYSPLGQTRDALMLAIWGGAAAMLLCHAITMLVLYARS